MSRLDVNAIRHTAGSSDNINLDSSGRVGVGQASPTHLLHVKDASQSLTGATLKLESSATTGAADTGPVIQFYGHSGSEPRYHSAIKGAKENGTSGNTAGYLAFATRPAGGAMAEQVRIASDGEFRFNSGYGSVAAAYGVRAWVNFTGSGTVTIKADGNVSSITDSNTGRYVVNFTNNMPDANYAYTLGARDIDNGMGVPTLQANPTTTPSTSSLSLIYNYPHNQSYYDAADVCVAIFR